MKPIFFPRAVLYVAMVMMTPLLLVAPVQAQEEGEPTVVDEVIAQVNNDVITLSMVKRLMKEAAKALEQRNNMTEQQATAEVARRQPEMIARLVDEQLLLQKGKDLNLSDQVEAEVNKRMLEVAKEQNIKTIEELDAALTANGMPPAEIRQQLRSDIMKGMVLSGEVDRKIYFSITADGVKKHFEANRDKFRRPESVVLSEIFLSLAGKPEAEVRAKAADLVAKARAGADFGGLAVAHSERVQDGKRVAETTKGSVGRVEISDTMREDIAAALKNLKPGGVTDPLRTGDGYQILRVDERTPAGEVTFNENQVREVMTMERAQKERAAYLQKLHDESYVKIAPNYREAVQPLLPKKAVATAARATDKSSTPAAPKPTEKKPAANGSKQQ